MSDAPFTFDLMTVEERDAARQALLDGKCPWCGPKVWKSVGLHIARKHKILAVDAKDALSIPPWVPLNLAELSEHRSELIRGWAPWEAARGLQVAGEGTKRLLSYTRAAQTKAQRSRAAEHAETREPNHGSMHEYAAHRCRCELCRGANAAMARNHRAKRKSEKGGTDGCAV